MKFLLQKRNKYILYSTLAFLLLFWFFSENAPNITLSAKVLIINVFCLTGVIFTQHPGISYKNAFPLILLPIHLFVGTILSLNFFPNLSLAFRISSLVFSSAALYLVSLVNNVFVVVEDKEETIPLYRVATTWAQILIVIIAIPFFAGVFKIPSTFFLQNIVVAISSFLFSLYLLWTLGFDKEVAKIGVGENIMVSLMVSFIVFSASISVSFLPSESFLRSLLSAGSLMFGLNYLVLHYKNRLNRKILLEYGFLLLIFLLLILIFRP